MSRKGENIRKRKDGRWEARYIKTRDSSGKICYGYVYGKTYREAKEQRNLKIATLSDRPKQQYTVTIDYCADVKTIGALWLKSIRHTVKESTYANYESILEKQILPELGNILLTEIDNSRLSSFIQGKLDKKMASGSIHVMTSVLKGILHYGEILGFSPAEALCFPKVGGSACRVSIMSTEHYRKLEQHLLNHLNPFCFGILLCMNTGIRVGELSGLRWEDIDFPEKKMYIRRTVSRIRNLEQTEDSQSNEQPKTILHIGSPKTVNSERVIPLPDRILTLAKDLQGQDSCYIMSGTEKCMEPRTIQRQFTTILKKCEIPHINIHALRHQFSCRWVEQGFDTKSLSEILGHTSVKTTLDLYVHIRMDTKREYMNQLMEKDF
jgi:integrase